MASSSCKRTSVTSQDEAFGSNARSNILKQLRKLRLVPDLVQGPHLHPKNGVVSSVDHSEANFQTVPDFDNTAKRQECPLDSRDDFFVGKHRGSQCSATRMSR
jgi:hypothetical protein